MQIINVKPKTVNFLEENIQEDLCDFGINKDFQDDIPKAQSIKEKMIIQFHQN